MHRHITIYDPTPRLVKVGDALSQLIQVALAPDSDGTTANESLSGRSHRCGWWTEHLIDLIFFWQREGHCKLAFERDVERARDYARQCENVGCRGDF